MATLLIKSIAINTKSTHPSIPHDSVSYKNAQTISSERKDSSIPINFVNALGLIGANLANSINARAMYPTSVCSSNMPPAKIHKWLREGWKTTWKVLSSKEEVHQLCPRPQEREGGRPLNFQMTLYVSGGIFCEWEDIFPSITQAENSIAGGGNSLITSRGN